jgi:hypothetical protein
VGFYWYYGPFDDNCKFFPNPQWLEKAKTYYPTGIEKQQDDIEQYDEEYEDEYPEAYLDSGVEPLGAASMFHYCFFQALAAAAVNENAYIFAPKVPEPWGANSIWQRIEFPALTANPNIKRIYQVDPQPLYWKREHQDPPGTPPEDCEEEEPDEPTLIWSRDRDPPVAFQWSCPVGTDIWPVPE